MVCNTAIELNIAILIGFFANGKGKVKVKTKNGEAKLHARCNFYKGQEKCHQVLRRIQNQKNISIFALYPCVDRFLLPQVSEKMQHRKMDSCSVTNLLCKPGSFVVVLQVCCCN